MFEVRLLGMFDIKYKKKPVVISLASVPIVICLFDLHAETAHRREKLAGMLKHSLEGDGGKPSSCAVASTQSP
jgi:hypothetical protein